MLAGRLLTSSPLSQTQGGNAGLAAATAAHALAVPCTAFVHVTTEKPIVDRLLSLGADVRPKEGGWDACNAAAADFVKTTPGAVYIHPFEGDDVVRGHSSIVTEIFDQIEDVARQAGVEAAVDVVGCSIGGGGFARGIMLGLTQRSEATGQDPTHFLAMCTIGADSFGKSLETEDTFVALQDAHSKAMSLTCKACSPTAVQDARAYATTGSIRTSSSSIKGKAGTYVSVASFSDSYAGAASWKYRRDFPSKPLIELGCGAALVPAYEKAILDRVAQKTRKKKLSVVIVACGGSRVSAEEVDRFEREYGAGEGDMYFDGEHI